MIATTGLHRTGHSPRGVIRPHGPTPANYKFEVLPLKSWRREIDFEEKVKKHFGGDPETLPLLVAASARV